MNEEKIEKAPKKKHKWISITIDCVLGALVVLFLFIQVETMVSSSKNRGVSSLFGKSVAYVLTDSMDVDSGTVLTYSSKLEKNADGSAKSLTYTVTDPIHTGNGVVISKVSSVSDIKPFDVVTFHMDYEGSDMVVTHRFIEYDEASSTLYLMGDNHCAGFYGGSGTCGSGGASYTYESNYNAVKWSDVVGKVTYNSKALGNVLSLVQSSWFVPVAVLVPLGIIAVMSGYDMIKESKKEEKEEDEEVKRAMEAAGVDPNDEAQVIKFEEKERYKIEMRKTMEKEKEAEKARLRKEIEKEKKRIKKELEAESKKSRPAVTGAHQESVSGAKIVDAIDNDSKGEKK